MWPPAAPPQEAGRPDDHREPQVEASLEGQQSQRGEAETGKAHLQLKRAVRPSDEACGQFSEEDVEDEIVEERKSDREQKKIREQRLDHDAETARPRSVPERDGRGEQAQHEERDRELQSTNSIASRMGAAPPLWFRSRGHQSPGPPDALSTAAHGSHGAGGGGRAGGRLLFSLRS